MSDTMRIALSGLNDASTRVSSAASNIANASSTTKDGKPYSGTDVTSSAQTNGGVSSTVVERSDGDGIDLSKEAVDLLSSSIAYKANAKVVKAESQNQKKLLDSVV